MTPQQLSYWAAVYNQLNERHDLFLTHGITFDHFIHRPEHYQHWVTAYFANPALLINRPHGAAVRLTFFLSDPNQILMAALMADSLRAEYQPVQRDLLPRQSVAAAMALWTDSAQDGHIHWRGNRYVEPFHHYHAPHKYKTGSHCRKARPA